MNLSVWWQTDAETGSLIDTKFGMEMPNFRFRVRTPQRDFFENWSGFLKI